MKHSSGSGQHMLNPFSMRLEPPDTLILAVHAADIAALRASLNMWLRLILVAEEMQELLNNQETIQ